jgi:VanZ family protein
VWAGVLFAAFVVYGSLVPLDFHPRPWVDAWGVFRSIPYLELSASHREDLVANLLLYIPITFLPAVALLRAARPSARIVISVAIGTLSVMLAIAVEFLQIYFPPRTVSVNDMVAQSIGGMLGILLALAALGRASTVWRGVTFGGLRALRATLYVYAVAYVVVSLLPYDFVLSQVEFSERLRATAAHWFLAPTTCTRVGLCAIKFGAEALATLPLGILLSMLRRPTVSQSLAAGAVLGLAIEGMQLLLVGGISQAASIATRATGMAAGVRLLPLCTRHNFELVQRQARTIIGFAALPYVTVLAFVNGLFGGPMLNFEAALQRLPSVHFIPFYYHYYVAESAAFLSVLQAAFAYLPIGIAVWAWREVEGNGEARGASSAALIAASLAAAVEMGKLFVSVLHPDPTNVLIAAAAAVLGWRCCIQLARWSTPLPVKSMTGRIDVGAVALQATPSRLLRVVGTMLAACVVVASLDYPNRGFVLLMWLIAYAAALVLRPRHFLGVIAALLPVLDLSPWSGRFFLDEFDLVVMTSLAIGFVVQPWPSSARPTVDGRLRLAVYGFLACYAVSVAIGLFPLSPLDANAFSNYFSHYNALRMAKGVAFGFALAFLVLRCLRSGVDVVRELTTGTAIGLALLVAVVLWERHAMVGVLDWTRDYRISGMFAGMHVGGGAVDAYLAMAVPVALLALGMSRGLVRSVAALIVVGAIYTVTVTYSRGAYIAVTAGLLVMAACALAQTRSADDRRRRLPTATVALTSIVLLAAAAFGGGYMNDRVGASQRDSVTRLEHWRDSLRLAGPAIVDRLFGIGVGRYPEEYFWHHLADSKLPTYRYEDDGRRTYLRLGGGALYMNQAVDVAPFTEYDVSVELRGRGATRGSVDIYVCNKWLLYSRDCQILRFAPDRSDGAWERHKAKLVSGATGGWAPWDAVAIRISLSNPAPGTDVDVGRVSVVDRGGKELLRNGDFSEGGDHWLFTTDEHLPWHAKNTAVHLRVEQGWLGLGLSLVLLAMVIRRLLPPLRQGDMRAGALTASLTGVLIVGMVDTVVDFPRLTLFLILIAAVALVAVSPSDAQRARPSQSRT